MNILKAISKKYVQRNLTPNSMVPALSLILFLMVCVFSIINPLFISINNIKSILTMAAGSGIMAAGLALVILGGNFDFSIGSTLGITVVIVAKLMNVDVSGGQIPLFVSLLAGILIGAIIGAINGALVSFVGLNSIIVTLGTLSIIRGISFWIIIDNIPVRNAAFVSFGRHFIFGIIPVNLLIWIAIMIIMAIFLKYSRTGRNIYLVGANSSAAKLSGINTKRTHFLSFVLSGCAASLGAIIRLSQIGFSDSTFGTGYEFHILVICVLGGISLLGGRGNLLGVFISTLIIGSISNGLALADVEINWREGFIGLILILSILIDVIIVNRSATKARNLFKKESINKKEDILKKTTGA